MTTHLVWFRRDLRLHDNLALAAACRDRSAQVLALYIATPEQWKAHDMAPRQAAFTCAQLNALQTALAEKGIPLLFYEVADFAASVDTIKSVCLQHDVSRLFYNYQYEINERQRDAAVEKSLPQVVCEGFDDSVILPPGAVMTGNHEMYKVFTPFKNAWLKRIKDGIPECVSAPKMRDSGALDAPLTSITPRQCLNRLLAEQPQALEGGRGSVWLNELIWREFYRHLMTYHPALCRYQPFIHWTDRVQWQNNPTHLQAWKTGSTGYPIVDAAMRQLNATGWMHNRLRMITASFLVKDLLIDWRKGEQYFMSQLIDGDLAANNGGWQWAASTGTDAAPYFRIFNPTTQGEKFDRDGEFIRQWVPELRDVPDKAIHDPWSWAEKAQVTLSYPRPIVDHKQARLATLAAYEAARKG